MIIFTSKQSHTDPIEGVTQLKVTIKKYGYQLNIYTPYFQTDQELQGYLDANEAMIWETCKQDFKSKNMNTFQQYNCNLYISYDVNGNLTCIDMNEHCGDGNPFIQKNIPFDPASNIVLYPENYVVMINPQSSQPDLYER